MRWMDVSEEIMGDMSSIEVKGQGGQPQLVEKNVEGEEED